MLEISNYKLIVFDLDNTLYNETDYLNIAYNYIAKKICDNNIELSNNQILKKNLVLQFYLQ